MSNDAKTNTETNTSTDRDHQAIVDDYLQAWNTTDPVVRAATVAAVYAADATVCDPLFEVAGHEQLTALFAHFHEAYAGAKFRQKGAIDAHHQLLRWGWEMVAADGSVMLDGLDVGVLDDEGKLASVAGFFGLALPGS